MGSNVSLFGGTSPNAAAPGRHKATPMPPVITIDTLSPASATLHRSGINGAHGLEGSERD
jgi:hypothetical protein